MQAGPRCANNNRWVVIICAGWGVVARWQGNKPADHLRIRGVQSSTDAQI